MRTLAQREARVLRSVRLEILHHEGWNEVWLLWTDLQGLPAHRNCGGSRMPGRAQDIGARAVLRHRTEWAPVPAREPTIGMRVMWALFPTKSTVRPCAAPGTRAESGPEKTDPV